MKASKQVTLYRFTHGVLGLFLSPFFVQFRVTRVDMWIVKRCKYERVYGLWLYAVWLNFFSLPVIRTENLTLRTSRSKIEQPDRLGSRKESQRRLNSLRIK